MPTERDQNDTVTVLDSQFDLSAGSTEPTYVAELVVTASGQSYTNHSRTPPIIYRDIPRPSNPDNPPSTPYQISYDATPDNLAEMRIAIQVITWDVMQEFLNYPDQVNELSAIIYMQEDGTLARGNIGIGTPTTGYYDVSGIPDRAKIVALIHSHPVPPVQGDIGGRFPGDVDWQSFTNYYTHSSFQSSFVQVVVHDGQGWVYVQGDTDTSSLGNLLRNPSNYYVGPSSIVTPEEEVALVGMATLDVVA